MDQAGEGGRISVAESGKRVIKRGLQLVVSTVGRPVWWFPNQSLVVLMYHRVLPDGHPDWGTMQPGMVVSARTFDLHLQILKEHFTLVHLGEWLQRARSGLPLPARACALTFDDGWSDAYETAWPLLRRHGVPATLFLVTDYVDTPLRFWPERLVEVLRRAARTPGAWSQPEFRWLRALGVGPGSPFESIISTAKSLPDHAIHERLGEMEERHGVQLPRAAHLMTWDQTRRMIADGLIEAGSHTCTHHRLGQPMDESQLLREIVGSKETLQQNLDKPVELFCYPNGEISPAADRIVRNHYLAACSTNRGWNDAEQDRHRLRRIGMHDGVSADYHAFLARLSGWI
jgi:peptidoglycan/xylan/chitin deacetylase (PgdA/CDA1 family)